MESYGEPIPTYRLAKGMPLLHPESAISCPLALSRGVLGRASVHVRVILMRAEHGFNP